MKVYEAMTKKPVTVQPNSSVQDAAKIMSEKKIGSIIISGNGEFSGILTERDLVRKVLARGKDPKSVKVNEIMSKPVVCCGSCNYGGVFAHCAFKQRLFMLDQSVHIVVVQSNC